MQAYPIPFMTGIVAEDIRVSQHYKTHDGIVQLEISCKKSDGTVMESTPIATLSVGFRTTGNIYAAIYATGKDNIGRFSCWAGVNSSGKRDDSYLAFV